jgi:propionyl-CoA carboxylase alpha chain
MFSKILIANRGEIACRIVRTARRLGIATVAVYSDADAEALHVRAADQAVRIGRPPSAESYLRIERIVEAAVEFGAEAVHPGYGFLSENARFAEALERAGLVFIGPPAAAIRAMGDKIESKKLAEAAGVNTVPGHLATIADAKEAAGIAAALGFPVMLKASAGGGGKGMRIARNAREAREGFVSAQNEARSSFGDDRIFVEKYIAEPRHIEIQVLADALGNCIHLGERECSIQRRHQKVIEEAPSPFVDAALRRAMGAQAVALAQAVGYRSAGTVEFIVDTKRNFYFLEMNTRLQVEHPVTEMVTGLDLVEEMLRIAAGKPLSLTQDEVRLDGWSIEARVYAEDPRRGFLPSIGRLRRCRPPAESADVRIDTGVAEGNEISMYYDPMLAKLVTRGADRAGAIAAMSQALDAFELRGIGHNLGFLAAVMANPRFRAGRLSTGFIAEEFGPEFVPGEPPPEVRTMMLAAAALVHWRWLERDGAIQGRLRPAETPPADWVVRLDNESHEVRLSPREAGLEVELSGHRLTIVGDWRPGQVLLQADVEGRAVTMQVEDAGVGFMLSHRGFAVRATVLRPRAAVLAALMPERAPPDFSRFVISPMSGLVVAVHVGPGDPVKAGQPVAVVEAMKMENVLRAERDGVVQAVRTQAGASIAADEVIVEFAP